MTYTTLKYSPTHAFLLTEEYRINYVHSIAKLYTIKLYSYQGRPALGQLDKLSSIVPPRWSYLLSAVQVHTTTH